MKRYPIILAAVASVAGLSAATAAAPNSGQTAPAQAARSAAAETQQADKGREICVRMEITGARLPKKVCRTAAEWEAAGGVPTE